MYRIKYWVFKNYHPELSDEAVEGLTRTVIPKEESSSGKLLVIAGYVYAFIATMGGLRIVRSTQTSEITVPADCLHESQQIGAEGLQGCATQTAHHAGY